MRGIPSPEMGLLPQTAGLGRANDLPPSWDGHVVEWRGWQTPPIPFHFKAGSCSACGSREQQPINSGLVYPMPGETVGTRPIRWLTAFRCLSCWHDVVWDKRDDTWWDLEMTDYSDNGSTEPEHR